MSVLSSIEIDFNDEELAEKYNSEEKIKANIADVEVIEVEMVGNDAIKFSTYNNPLYIFDMICKQVGEADIAFIYNDEYNEDLRYCYNSDGVLVDADGDEIE